MNGCLVFIQRCVPVLREGSQYDDMLQQKALKLAEEAFWRKSI
jgi:hypothetical protein